MKSIVLFTLGTGVGGGIIIHDKVLEGRHSHGGEVGHMKIAMKDARHVRLRPARLPGSLCQRDRRGQTGQIEIRWPSPNQLCINCSMGTKENVLASHLHGGRAGG